MIGTIPLNPCPSVQVYKLTNPLNYWTNCSAHHCHETKAYIHKKAWEIFGVNVGLCLLFRYWIVNYLIFQLQVNSFLFSTAMCTHGIKFLCEFCAKTQRERERERERETQLKIHYLKALPPPQEKIKMKIISNGINFHVAIKEW